MTTPGQLEEIIAAVSAALGPPSIGEGFPNPVASLFQAGNTTVITPAGLFIYSGTPASGNLILSATPAAGTDAWSNTYPQGLNVTTGTISGTTITGGTISGAAVTVGTTPSSSSTEMQMTASGGLAALSFLYESGWTAGVLQAAIFGSGTTRAPYVLLQSPNSTTAGQTDYVSLELFANNANGTTPSAMYAYYNDAGGTAHFYMIMGDGGCNIAVGSITAAHPGTYTAASPAVAETWQSLGSPSATNWISDVGRYRMTAEGEVEFDIMLEGNTGGGTAGTYTYANTLPAAYQPTNPSNTTRAYPLGYNSATVGIAACALIDGATTGNPGRVRIVLPALPVNTWIGSSFRMPIT